MTYFKTLATMTYFQINFSLNFYFCIFQVHEDESAPNQQANSTEEVRNTTFFGVVTARDKADKTGELKSNCTAHCLIPFTQHTSFQQKFH
jgi:hypothetical protein